MSQANIELVRQSLCDDHAEHLTAAVAFPGVFVGCDRRVEVEPRVARRIASPTAVVAVPGGLDAGPAARRALRRYSEGLATTVFVAIELMIGELVMNAVKDAQGAEHQIEVRLHKCEEAATVAVFDHGGTFEWVGRPGGKPAEAGGWGLVIVDELADAWGVGYLEGRKTVWFEKRIA